MDGWNTIVSFWDGPFSGAFAVSFRECSVQGAGCPCCICGAPNGCICGGATSSAMAGSGAAEAHKATRVDLSLWELRTPLEGTIIFFEENVIFLKFHEFSGDMLVFRGYVGFRSEFSPEPNPLKRWPPFVNRIGYQKLIPQRFKG